MRYSLVNVFNEKDGFVDGVWMQHHTGTLETAIERARATEKVNSNQITVAVVEELSNTMPDYSNRFKLKRLD